MSGGPPEVWDGDLPEVWQGPAPEDPESSDPGAEEASPASLEEIYADLPAGEDPQVYQPRRDGPRGEEREVEASPLTRRIASLAIPAATILMVASLLFFLYDVRSVYLPGSPALKWVVLCFASATVLIERYVCMRAGRVGSSSSFYTLALAGATGLAMLASPWEARSVGFAGGLSNLLIVFLVWKFATALTRHLSADLESPNAPRRPKLFGLERLAMESARAERKGTFTIYDVGRRENLERRRRSDGRAATRSVIRLILLALVLFALCEPVLLAGSPDIAGRALGAVVVFLFAAALVVAAATSVHDSQRLEALGADGSLVGLVGRLGFAALLMVCVLSVALGLPGVASEGRGEIQALRGGEEMNASSGEPAAEDPAQKSGGASQSQDALQPESQTQADGASGGGLLEVLIGLGQLLRWPIYALALAGALIALWRLGPRGWRGARRRWQSLRERLRSWLARRRTAAAPPADPLLGAALLGALPNRQCVLAAYGVWLAVCDRLGASRPNDQTPLEMLSALPARLAELRAPGDRLTRLYVRAAYDAGEISDHEARQARKAIEELQFLMPRLLEGARVVPGSGKRG
ncbi:MAG: DUF4129 domain-containing protein [Acidobacteriota bacterium]